MNERRPSYGAELDAWLKNQDEGDAFARRVRAQQATVQEMIEQTAPEYRPWPRHCNRCLPVFRAREGFTPDEMRQVLKVVKAVDAPMYDVMVATVKKIDPRFSLNP